MNLLLVTMKLRMNYLYLKKKKKGIKKEKYYYPGCEFDDEGEEKYTCELINVIDFLWTKFNCEEKSSFTLTSAKKVWKYSKLVTCKEFVKVGFILESAAHRRSVKKVF